MKFEHMYKKKLEFEFAKILIERENYEVKQNYFWIIYYNITVITALHN